MACLTFRVCIAQLEMGSDEYEEMEEEKEGEKEDDDKNQQIRMNFMKMTRRRDRQKSLMLSFEDIIVLTLFFFFFKQIDFTGGSDGKKSACNAGDLGLIPGLGISSGEGKGYPLQYSCLENSMDRGAWWATVHGVEKSRT